MGRRLTPSERENQFELPLDGNKRQFVRDYWVGRRLGRGATVSVFMTSNGIGDEYHGEIISGTLGKRILTEPVIGPTIVSQQRSLPFVDFFGKPISNLLGDPKAAKSAAEALKPVIKEAWKNPPKT